MVPAFLDRTTSPNSAMERTAWQRNRRSPCGTYAAAQPNVRRHDAFISGPMLGYEPNSHRTTNRKAN